MVVTYIVDVVDLGIAFRKLIFYRSNSQECFCPVFSLI